MVRGWENHMSLSRGGLPRCPAYDSLFNLTTYLDTTSEFGPGWNPRRFESQRVLLYCWMPMIQLHCTTYPYLASLCVLVTGHLTVPSPLARHHWDLILQR